MNSYDRIYSLLLEYDGNNPAGKFAKDSPLTPQKHDLKGRTEKEEVRANFRAMADALRKAQKEIKRTSLWARRRCNGHKIRKTCITIC